ncbi:hypothetical protein HY504_00785 [Candidatus Wolfebacteria bacterium]|nr:hypothetical protein [Candidatus Wolfebacteria bacterium]
MKRSLALRIRVTRRGKILRRAMGQSHFRAKKNAGQINRKKGMRSIDKSMLKKYL